MSDLSFYTTLTRQSGLMREMRIVANNIANASTTGYRAGGVLFSEVVRTTGDAGGSVSMAAARAERVIDAPGALRQTGGAYDLAIDGPGHFRISGPDGDLLTRAGHFAMTPDGGLVSPDGRALLDDGGAPVFVPPGATSVTVAPDGTLTADGFPIARIGLWAPPDGAAPARQAGAAFTIDGEPLPQPEAGAIRQGFLEGSNVDPVREVARMIEVQRAYELGQNFLDKEDERIRSMLRSLNR